jgi:hypothetical protein
MSKILAGFAALTLLGAAALPLPATAAERQGTAITKQTADTTDVSSRHRGYRHRYVYRHRHWGPRRYWGPHYGYYGYPYGYPYGYYRPAPLIGFGVGPFGFRVF